MPGETRFQGRRGSGGGEGPGERRCRGAAPRVEGQSRVTLPWISGNLEARRRAPRVEVAAEREIRRREHAVGEVGDGHVEQRHDQHKHLERVKDRHVAGEPVEVAQLRKRPRQQQQSHLRDGARDGANHHEHDEGGREARVEPAALPREQAELDERVLAWETKSGRELRSGSDLTGASARR